MKNLIRALLASITIGYLSSAFAVPGESIVFNPATGNYLITYQNSDDNSFHQVIFIPATKINPTLNSKLKLEQNGYVHFGYLLISGLDSQQDITLIIFDSVSSVTTVPDIPLNTQADQAAMDMLNTEGAAAIDKAKSIVIQAANEMDNAAKYFDTPSPWRASLTYSNEQKAFRIGWDTKVDNGMHPGGQATFGFKSRDLPGIIHAEVHGYAPGSQEIPGEETQDAKDGGFGQQYTELVDINNFVPRNIAVPAIAVPTPFDPAVTLERIQAQMHTWIAMQLIDPAFSAQLDRNFQSAADAYRNQGQAGNGQIGRMLALLVQQYEELERGDEELVKQKSAATPQIDKLAALVLYFDLKYVQRASGGN
jgi:hypothetical protein